MPSKSFKNKILYKTVATVNLKVLIGGCSVKIFDLSLLYCILEISHEIKHFAKNKYPSVAKFDRVKS